MAYQGDSTDDLIRRAIGDGANLPNAGRRLELDDPYTPDDLKLAHKILKDNGFVPTWIAESRELDTLRDDLIRQLTVALRATTVSQTLNAEISAFNKRVLSFNLKAPQGISHKRIIDHERERRRLTNG